MPTFVHSRERLFLSKHPETLSLVRKRSDGRLKAYNSATDVRSWTNDSNRQREYFLDSINQADTTYGNYVPFLALLDILGLKDNAKLLNDTVEKLTIINEVLQSRAESDVLSKSEEELKANALRHGASPEEVDDETIRNLRNLVRDLIDQYKYFTGVKNENDELRKTMSEQSQLLESQVDDLTYQRNVLQAKVQALNGIEDKVEKMKKELDGARNTIRRLRKQLDGMPDAEQLRILRKKADDFEKLKDENLKIRTKLFKLRKAEVEMTTLQKDNDYLRAVVGDQEDEIQILLEKLEESTGGKAQTKTVPEVVKHSQLQLRRSASRGESPYQRQQSVPRTQRTYQDEGPTLRKEKTPIEASPERNGLQVPVPLPEQYASVPQRHQPSRVSFPAQETGRVESSRKMSPTVLQPQRAKEGQDVQSSMQDESPPEHLPIQSTQSQPPPAQTQISLERPPPLPAQPPAQALPSPSPIQAALPPSQTPTQFPPMPPQPNEDASLLTHQPATSSQPSPPIQTPSQAAPPLQPQPLVQSQSPQPVTQGAPTRASPPTQTSAEAAPLPPPQPLTQPLSLLPQLRDELVLSHPASLFPESTIQTSDQSQELLNAQQKCAYFEDVLQKIQDELEKKMAEMDKTNKKVEEWENRALGCEEREKKLQDELEQSRKALTEGTGDVERLKAELQITKDESNKNLKDLDVLKRRAAEAAEEIVKLKEFAHERDQIRKRVGELEKALLDKQEELDSLKASKGDHAELIIEVDNLKLALAECHDELNREHAAAQKGLVAASSLEVLQKELDQLKGVAKDKDNEVSKTKAELERIMAELASLRSNWDSSQAELQKALADLNVANTLITSLQDKITALENEQNGARNHLKKMQDELDLSREALTSAEDKVTKVQLDDHELKRRANDLEAENKELRAHLAELGKEVERLKIQINACQEETGRKSKEEAVLRMMLAEQKEELEKTMKDLESSKEQLAHITKVNQTFKDQLGGSEKNIEVLRATLADVQNNLGHKDVELKKLKSQLDVAEKSKTELDKAKEQDSVQIAQLVGELEQKDKAMDIMKAKLAALESELNEAKKGNDALQVKIAGEQQKVEDIGDASRKTLAEKKDRISQLEGQLKDALGKLDHLGDQIKKCQNDYEQALQDIEVRKEKQKVLADMLQVAQQDAAQAKEKQKTFEGDLSNARNQLNEVTKKLHNSEKQNENDHEKLKAANERIDVLAKQAEDLKTALSKTNEEIGGANRDKDNLMSQLAKELSASKSVENELKKSHSKVRELTSSMDKLREDQTKLLDELAKTKKKLGENESEIAGLKVIKDQMGAELTEKNDKLQKQADMLKQQEASVNESKEKLAKIDAEKDQLVAAKNKLIRDLERSEIKLREEEAKITTIEVKSKMIADVDKKFDKATADLTRLEQKFDGSKAKHDGRATEHTKLKTDLELDECRKSLADSTKKFQGLKTEHDHLMSDHTKLTKEKKSMEIKMQKEVDNLNEKLNVLQRELEREKCGGALLVSESKNFKDQIEKLNGELVKMKKSNRDLAQGVDASKALHGEKEVLKMELQAEKGKVAELKKELPKKVAELENLARSNSNMERSLRAAELAADKSKDNINQLKHERDTLRDEIERLNKEMKIWKDSARMLEVSSAGLENKMQSQADTSTRKLNALLAELDEKENKIKECERMNKMLEGLLKNSETEMTVSKKELAAEKKKVRELMNDLNNEQVKATSEAQEDLQRNLKASHMANAALENEVVACRKNENLLSEEIELLKKELADKTYEAECLARELANLKKQSAKMGRELERTKQLFDECSQEKSKVLNKAIYYEDQVSCLEKKLRTCIETQEDLESDLRICKCNNKEYEREIACMRDNLLVKDKLLGNSNKKIGDLNNKIHELELMTEHYSSSLTLLREENDSARERIEKMSSVLEELQRQKIYFETDAKLKDETIHHLRSEVGDLERHLSDLEKENKHLKDQSHSSENTMAADRALIHKLQLEIDSLMVAKQEVVDRLEEVLGALDEVCIEKTQLNQALIDCENVICELNAKLRCEKDLFLEKLGEIRDLQEKLKATRNQLDRATDVKEELEAEKDLLRGEVLELHSDLGELRAQSPIDTPFNRIIKKILRTGDLSQLTLQELAELHNASSKATAILIEKENAKLTDKAPIVKCGPSVVSMPDQKKAILKKTAILQNEVTRRQLEARKRTCALTQAIQQYQRELTTLKIWDVNLQEARAETTPEGKARQAMLKAQAEQRANQINHCICMAECEKQRAVELEEQLQKAMDSVKNVQKTVLTPTSKGSNELAMQNKIMESLKEELKKSVMAERLLAKLLLNEKDKVSSLESHLRKVDGQEKEQRPKDVEGKSSGQETASLRNADDLGGHGEMRMAEAGA